MSKLFAIYTRASEAGADGPSSDPEEQEAAARAWADRAGVEVIEVVHDTASGGGSADDRDLGKLIERCEADELAGIIVRDEKRFARDSIGGAVALARLVECEARLIATWSGFDSGNLTPESEMMFGFMMSIGQAERKRNLARRRIGKENYVKAGGWAGVAPFGYDRLDKRDGGNLVVNDEEAEIVRQIFRLRIDGLGFNEITRQVGNVLSRSGVRKVIANRSYLGEQRLPGKRKGEPEVATNYPGHAPLVTPTQWEAANAVQGKSPVHTGLSERVELKGIVRCGACKAIMHVLLYGKEKDRLTYACTTCGKTSMSVAKIEPAVLHQLDVALEEHEPHVAAVMEGDTRYTDALAAVEQAQDDLVAYRDSSEILRELGTTQFAAGLQVRKEAVEVARRTLREMPRPFEQSMTAEQFGNLNARVYYPRLIAEVLVFPRSSKHRLTMRWQGDTKNFPVPSAPKALDLAEVLQAA